MSMTKCDPKIMSGFVFTPLSSVKQHDLFNLDPELVQLFRTTNQPSCSGLLLLQSPHFS